MRRKTNFTTLYASFAMAVLLAALTLIDVTPANAQDALGNGRVLDGSLSTESTINQAARQEDYRVRNLLVTDNVPGGRGFRGSVGYTAADDFRGNIGSDDLYRFRADSAFSAPSFINYGQTYEQLRFGSYLGSLEFSRDFQGSTLRDVLAPAVPKPGEMIDARLRLDRISRSSQGVGVYDSDLAGDTVGYTYDKDGKLLVARASALQGIELTPADNDAQQIGLTPFDMARLREQAKTNKQALTIGQQFVPQFEDVLDPYHLNESSTTTALPKPDSFVPGQTVSDRVDSSIPAERLDTHTDSSKVTSATNSYRDVLKRVVERYAGQDNVSMNIDPALVKEFEQEYKDLRSTLNGKGAEIQVPLGVPSDTVTTEQEPTTNTTPRIGADAGVDSLRRPAGATTQPNLDNTTEIDRLASTLRHGAQIDHLSAGDDSRYNELVATAEKALRDGEFFLAERRFDRALRFSPGNPLATAGMGHAQIGSGLYLSAALTIRTLLTNNPEMIDVHYDPALVPARNRLEAALTSTRERIESKHDVSLNSFLEAYLGKLLNDPGVMREGLDSLAKAMPGDPLEKLLRAVWLASDKPADQPQK